LYINHLELKNFRCFTHYEATFHSPLTLIEGDNGTGKSSILEAIHYLCYLRSFRTYNPRHLVRQEEEGFFAKIIFKDTDSMGLDHDLQAGFASKKRLVKLDGHAITSYKGIMDHYRVITLSEYDLELINGAPEMRRSFLDQAIVLADPEYSRTVAEARKLVDHRNSILQRGGVNNELYQLWTQQLWQKTVVIQEVRQCLLQSLQEKAQKLMAAHLPEIPPFALLYKPKRSAAATSFEDFWARNSSLAMQEQDYGYSLMGPHLDDFSISWQGGSSKLYASRGQQKLLVLLLRLAQAEYMHERKGPLIILVDDFLTDFDKKRAQTGLRLLRSLPCQCIMTAPIEGFLADAIESLGGERINLTPVPLLP
jgi:DNA replication and repair protein RecF